MTHLKVYKMYFDYIHPHCPLLSHPTDPQFFQLVSGFSPLLQFSPAWPHPCCVPKGGLQLLILLPPKCWAYKHHAVRDMVVYSCVSSPLPSPRLVHSGLKLERYSHTPSN